MMALAVPNPPTTPRRVKVYELRNNDWFDRGTGYCTGQLVNDEPHIQVKSEDESDRVLLQTKIIKDDGYQKQQETLIVWTEPAGIDMALSFQEPEGCAAIWEFVSHVQSHLLNDEILSDDAGEAALSMLVQLPTPTLGNLGEIEIMIRQASATVMGRDALAKYIITDEWLAKLIPMLEVAEDLESLENLHRLCNIMKMVILLNDTMIVETIVSDEMIMGVVGILEYDPDFPSHKANHRQFLSDKSKFKEVVPIRDPEISRKIHQTYRLLYLKDVVLARILDDPTFSVLNSLIFFNHFDILQHLQGNAQFMGELFALFKPDSNTPHAKKKAGIQFIQNCCQVAKSIQVQARTQLLQNFTNNGVFGVIDQALQDSDAAVRIAATDVLVSLIDHDAVVVRHYIYRQINEKQKPITNTLIQLLLGEQDLGVKSQIADAMRVLLDHTSGAGGVDGLAKQGDLAARIHARSTTVDSEGEVFLKSFYEESAKMLFQPLKDLEGREPLNNLTMNEVSLYSHLVDTLCFFVRQHHYRSKYFLLNENLPERVAQLLGSSEKHLKLAALKFFRTCVGLQDEYYIRHMVKNKLFEPILNVVVETMPKDNLLNSACLEFFEYIRRENMKFIISHLVETYRPLLSSITYVKTFNSIIERYEQNNDPTPPNRYNPSSPHNANGARRWAQGVREMDADEEAYFNASDDEDETPPLLESNLTDEDDIENTPPTHQKVKILNGSPPASPTTGQKRTLVDYEDEDEDEDMPTPPPSSSAAPVPSTPSPALSPTTTPAATPPSGPPKRKLRADDDDDDDDMIDKLAKSGKKDTPGLVRKRSFVKNAAEKQQEQEGKSPPPGNGLNSGVRKIAISLGAKRRAGTPGSGTPSPLPSPTGAGSPLTGTVGSLLASVEVAGMKEEKLVAENKDTPEEVKTEDNAADAGVVAKEESGKRKELPDVDMNGSGEDVSNKATVADLPAPTSTVSE